MSQVLNRKKFEPLAQTFYVPQGPGVYLTKVDLWFKKKSSTLPISIEIRPAKDKSEPSKQFIVPGSMVSLKAADVQIADASDAANTPPNKPATFEFEEPVYLGPDRLYALIVRTNAGKDYEIWASFIGDFEFGSTTKRVTKDIEPGILYRPGQGLEYIPEPTADIMFKLYRADFNATSGTAVFNVSNPSVRALSNNPLTTTSGDTGIIVNHPNHGFQVNDIVSISGAVDTNGISAANINGSRTIIRVDPYGYKIFAGASDTATASGRGGGSAITATEQYQFDNAFLNVETLSPAERSDVTFTGDFVSSKSFASLIEAAYSQTTGIKISNGTNFKLSSPHVVLTDSNETVHNYGNESVKITATLTNYTTDDRVSPTIDLQRSYMNFMSNLIDYNDSADSAAGNILLNYVGEDDPRDGSALAKHITREVRLTQPANGIKVLLGAHVPTEGDIEVWYRTASTGSDVDLRAQSWVYAAFDNTPPKDQNPDVVRDYEVSIGGEFMDELQDFDRYQIKVVMKSKSSSKVQRIRDLRKMGHTIHSRPCNDHEWWDHQHSGQVAMYMYEPPSNFFVMSESK